MASTDVFWFVSPSPQMRQLSRLQFGFRSTWSQGFETLPDPNALHAFEALCSDPASNELNDTLSESQSEIPRAPSQRHFTSSFSTWKKREEEVSN